ncbi:MAG: ABC transporter permease, partial [Candidatus Bathyarchaeota archaeon]
AHVKLNRSVLKSITKPLAFVFLLCVAWEIAVKILDVHPVLLPAPSLIASFVFENGLTLLYHTSVTVYEAIIGLILGVSVGLAFGIIIVYSKVLRDATLPLLLAADIIPKAALAPLLLIIFGFGILPKIVIVILITFFPVVINTAAGLASIQPELTDLAHSFKASGWLVFYKIRFPNALPYVFAGLRIAVPLSFVGAVIAEFAGTVEGIGWVLLDAILTFRTEQTIAGIIFAALAGITLFSTISIVERKTMPWYKEDRVAVGVY